MLRIATKTLQNMEYLKLILGQNMTIIDGAEKKVQPKFEMTAKIASQDEAMHSKLILSGRSKNTVKQYRSYVLKFLKHFEHCDISALTKEEIENYMYILKNEYDIGDSLQNGIINAIKFYLEKVLELPRTKYNLTRPKKSKTLPGVLSESDAYKLINMPANIKHRAILTLIYSAGLRPGEVTRIRVEDISSDEMMVFVKGAKGKKDRVTVLAESTLALLRAYFRVEKPSYWLFEGQSGSRYSNSSVSKIFRRAAKKAKVAEWATPHTLRHSFATHLLQENVNLRFIQSCLGHNSPETTQIYTHIANINNNIVRSPLDRIIDKRKKKNNKEDNNR